MRLVQKKIPAKQLTGIFLIIDKVVEVFTLRRLSHR